MKRSLHFPSRRARRAGFSLTDALVGATLTGLVVTAVMSFVSASTRSVDRRLVESALDSRARTAVGEVVRELRSGYAVQPSLSVGGKTVTTGASSIAFLAPGYNSDPAAADGVLAENDTVAFWRDPATKNFYESTAVTAGSKRPARANFVLARKVESVTFAYRVRERLDGTGANKIGLGASPKAGTTVSAFINGTAASSCTYNAGTNQVTLSPTPSSGADVQLVYEVDPAAGGPSLRLVNGVDVTLTLSDTDGRSVRRTVTLTGNARLRNLRL